MDRATILAVGAAAGSILAAVAMHGEAALKAAAGIPALLQAWSAGLPLGLWSFVLALLLSLLVWATCIYSMKPEPGKTPHIALNVIAFAVAEAVTVAQQWVQADDRPGAILNAIFMGGVAGLLAPFLGLMIRSMLRSKA